MWLYCKLKRQTEGNVNNSNLPPSIGPTDIDRRLSLPEGPINNVGDRTTILNIFTHQINFENNVCHFLH